ncbi:MAG: metallophosphoesterase [Saprospiraceae bacterium]|nr:metallophosphoesterase [Saprospiraceae bacterium]
MGFVVVILVFLGLDLYAFMGLRPLLLGLTPSIRIGIILIYWVISLSLPLLYLLNPVDFRRPSSGSTWFVVLANIWMIIGISKLVFILSLFGEDIFRFLSGVSNKFFSNSEESDTFLPSRRKFVGQTALVLSSLPFLSLTYGLFKGRYQFKIHRKEIFYKDLPQAFDGLTITQLSDIHAGGLDDADEVQKALDMVHELNSDILVFTGDLVNTFASEFDPWLAQFSTLKAKFGKFSVLGNHDYGHYHNWTDVNAKRENFDQLVAHHANMGFQLLRDESIKIERDGQHIHVLGVENWGVGFGKLGDLDKAMQTVSAEDFKVLLSHDPTHWEFVVKNHPKFVHLTLSGHTHGMQMGIELPGFKWSPIQYRYSKWSDLHKEQDRYLYINRGFGVLGYRGRVGIWPEITHITLRRAPSESEV